MPYTIMTDSATDMPKEIVEKFDLHVIPTPVVIEETVLRFCRSSFTIFCGAERM